MKVVINKCYGGFGISEAAVLWMRQNGSKEALPSIDGGLCTLKGEKYDTDTTCDTSYDSYGYGMTREDAILIACVESLGELSWGRFAKLRVVEIPDGISYYIDEYDGMEKIAETHQTWG